MHLVVRTTWSRGVRTDHEATAGTSCCVLRQDNLHSQRLSTQVYKMGTGELNSGGSPAMDQHSIQGGVEILIVA